MQMMVEPTVNGMTFSISENKIHDEQAVFLYISTKSFPVNYKLNIIQNKTALKQQTFET